MAGEIAKLRLLQPNSPTLGDLVADELKKQTSQKVTPTAIATELQKQVKAEVDKAISRWPNRSRTLCPTPSQRRSAHEPLRHLGVAPSATDEIYIRAAYKRLAMKYHPDREGGDAEKFDAVKKAA